MICALIEGGVCIVWPNILGTIETHCYQGTNTLCYQWRHDSFTLSGTLPQSIYTHLELSFNDSTVTRTIELVVFAVDVIITQRHEHLELRPISTRAVYAHRTLQ